MGTVAPADVGKDFLTTSELRSHSRGRILLKTFAEFGDKPFEFREVGFVNLKHTWHRSASVLGLKAVSPRKSTSVRSERSVMSVLLELGAAP